MIEYDLVIKDKLDTEIEHIIIRFPDKWNVKHSTDLFLQVAKQQLLDEEYVEGSIMDTVIIVRKTYD